MKSRSALRTAGLAAATLVICFAPPSVQAGSNTGQAQRNPVAAAGPSGSWTIYHRDNAHTGYDSTQPPAAGATAGWTSPTLDGDVYGEPLVYNGLVYVATLQNTVYALNQSTGAVAWSRNLGVPQTGGWQCGNINPTGILGTGVIDAVASRIYVVAFLNQYLSYFLFGLDLATGNQVLLTQVSPNGFDWTIQQQRGALALSTDRSHVYVPFGGRIGDCGAYHGWVDGIPTNGGAPDELFVTPSTASGIWAPGGVVVDDATGHVFFATGNAIPCSGAVQSDSVIETNATLGGLSFFQPADWQNHWCGPDWDLGSASPVLISPSLMFMSGKYGQGFLLNPAALGGTNGQLFPARSPYVGADVCVGNNADATFGSFAYAAPRVYLECHRHGIVSLTVNTATPSFSLCDSTCSAAGTWQAGGTTTFGPPIVAGGVVWAVDIAGSGLYGFDASTGAPVYQSAGFGAHNFTTPSEAGGQIFVSAGTSVMSFNIVGGCSTMSASAQPPATATVGTNVTVTGVASGPASACANPQYEFWLLPPGGTWSLAQGYSPNATYNWNTTGLAAGTYRFSVWAREAGSGSSYDSLSAFNYSLTTTPCTAMSASAAPPTSATVGTTVTITGSATGCPNPRYEFWVLPPGGSWTLAQGYSSSNTLSWNTAGKATGTYRFSVWARDLSTPGTAYTYDAFSAFNYALTTTPCTAVSAAAAPPTSAGVGTTVTITGSATGCPNPQYEFWVLPPGGSWTLAQGYSSSNTLSWNTAGKATGTYRFSVWARDLSTPGTAYTYDAFSAFNYALTTTPCTAMSAAAAPPTSASVGTTVTITGSATGCPNPQYEFWVLPPGGSWTLAQGYSSSSTLSWNTVGKPAGTYRFSVWARDASSPGTAYTYDAFSAFNYTLTTTPCTTMSASAAPPTSASVGTTVTITGSPTGCPNPLYEFWVLPPGGSWTLAQGYSTTSTLTWNTAGKASGTYRFSVWARDASSPGTAYTYDAFSAFNYTLT